MIEVETVTRWRSQRTFDRAAALLIGLIAILAGLCAVEQAFAGQEGTRAQGQAARLAADVSAKISVTSVSLDASAAAGQQWVLLGMQGISRQMAGSIAGDTAGTAVGAAQQAASEKLKAAVDETMASSGRTVDAYVIGLLSPSNDDLNKEVAEQNRQVDLAAAAGAVQTQAVLALSLVALAGVLAGVSAVLGSGKSGWAVLVVAWIAAGTAFLPALGGLF
ncbi:MAG: hypothetical protein WCK58_15770 [Chloroflexota bacterium]